jgi:hypothetical protein
MPVPTATVAAKIPAGAAEATAAASAAAAAAVAEESSVPLVHHVPSDLKGWRYMSVRVP